ncbi:hypothetical protein Tco_0060120 [Tanacetum coccineum]
MFTNLTNFLDMAPLPAADRDFVGLTHRDETGSGSEDEDGIFWRGVAGVYEMSDTVIYLGTVDTLCFQLGGAKRRMTWRQFILKLGLHTQQEMAEAGFGSYWARNRRKSAARLLGGHFIGRLAMHFGQVSDEGLRGLQGPKRQQAAAAGASKADKDGEVAEEVASEILAIAQAPPPPPPAPQSRTMSQRIERLKEDLHDLCHEVVGRAFPPSSLESPPGPRMGDASTSAAPHNDAPPNP